MGPRPLGHTAEDLHRYVNYKVEEAAGSLGVDLINPERTWLTAVLDEALFRQADTPNEGEEKVKPIDVTISEQLNAAMQLDGKAEKAKGLVVVGKHSLLKSGGIGSRVKTNDPACNYYRELASTAFRAAASLAPHIEEDVVLSGSSVKPRSLVLDPEEVRRLELRAVVVKQALAQTPWLLRIANKVPELSKVISRCRESLFGEENYLGNILMDPRYFIGTGSDDN